MKVITAINQNIPIWSILCGDHALKNTVGVISPKLLEEPNFLNPLENKLRLQVMKDKRKWILDAFKTKNPSFALVKFSIKDLEEFNTCFAGITFKQLAKQYRKAIKKKKGFKYKGLSKTKADVKEMKLLAKRMTFNSSTVSVIMILDTTLKNDMSLRAAVNRTLLLKQSDGKTTIMDGTHRLIAYWLAVRKTKAKATLHAFYTEV